MDICLTFESQTGSGLDTNLLPKISGLELEGDPNAFFFSWKEWDLAERQILEALAFLKKETLIFNSLECLKLAVLSNCLDGTWESHEGGASIVMRSYARRRGEDFTEILLTWSGIEGYQHGLRELQKLLPFMLRSLKTQHIGFQARGLMEGALAKLDAVIETSRFVNPN